MPRRNTSLMVILVTTCLVLIVGLSIWIGFLISQRMASGLQPSSANADTSTVNSAVSATEGPQNSTPTRTPPAPTAERVLPTQTPQSEVVAASSDPLALDPEVLSQVTFTGLKWGVPEPAIRYGVYDSQENNISLSDDPVSVGAGQSIAWNKATDEAAFAKSVDVFIFEAKSNELVYNEPAPNYFPGGVSLYGFLPPGDFRDGVYYMVVVHNDNPIAYGGFSVEKVAESEHVVTAFTPPEESSNGEVESNVDVQNGDITYQQYSQLIEGMSYEEAVVILGREGVEMSRSDMAGYTTVMYVWENSGFANLTAMFQNDKLISKAQIGLE